MVLTLIYRSPPRWRIVSPEAAQCAAGKAQLATDR